MKNGLTAKDRHKIAQNSIFGYGLHTTVANLPKVKGTLKKRKVRGNPPHKLSQKMMAKDCSIPV